MSNKEVQKYFKKKVNIDIKKMGIDVDKNEYSEIVLSNSNNPENIYKKNNSNKG